MIVLGSVDFDAMPDADGTAFVKSTLCLLNVCRSQSTEQLLEFISCVITFIAVASKYFFILNNHCLKNYHLIVSDTPCLHFNQNR